MYNCLENLVIFQVRSQAYLFIRKGLMRRLVWVLFILLIALKLALGKMYNFFACFAFFLRNHPG